MNQVLPTMPVSALRSKQAQIISSLDTSPIALTSNGYEAAVLVSPARWNEMVALINRLEDSRIIRTRSQEMDSGNWVSADEVEQGLRSRGLLHD